MTSWKERIDADGDRYWTLEYLGHYAAVTRFGQAWESRIWPQNDDEPWLRDFRDSPAMAMAYVMLLIEAEVRAEA